MPSSLKKRSNNKVLQTTQEENHNTNKKTLKQNSLNNLKAITSCSKEQEASNEIRRKGASSTRQRKRKRKGGRKRKARSLGRFPFLTILHRYVKEMEPFKAKNTIKDEVYKERVVFYDNNLLANPSINDILNELIELRREGKIQSCEAQSGFDDRILSSELAVLIKEAGFVRPRIAWDGPFGKHA